MCLYSDFWSVSCDCSFLWLFQLTDVTGHGHSETGFFITAQLFELTWVCWASRWETYDSCFKRQTLLKAKLWCVTETVSLAHFLFVSLHHFPLLVCTTSYFLLVSLHHFLLSGHIFLNISPHRIHLYPASFHYRNILVLFAPLNPFLVFVFISVKASLISLYVCTQLLIRISLCKNIPLLCVHMHPFLIFWFPPYTSPLSFLSVCVSISLVFICLALDVTIYLVWFWLSVIVPLSVCVVVFAPLQASERHLQAHDFLSCTSSIVIV